MNKYLTIACAAALSTLMACSGGKGNADKSTDSTAAAETAKETVQAEDSTGNPNARMAPMIEILDQKYGGKVDFYRVDVDKEKELAGDVFGIEAMPTFVYIDKSGAINSTTGAINAKEMISNIEKYCLD